ncbi:hypothetical protein BpHYR1_002076 [Brachionus plicatilis]|uniref:Uncharacterized protein n=1 Tax=Brachionus plicatilis TaxID=10195 RepID=A0A3M7Q317_BRAPC|nr:hypothetical protein BpHYR1_002076 [Brachionus plicatilis]
MALSNRTPSAILILNDLKKEKETSLNRKPIFNHPFIYLILDISHCDENRCYEIFDKCFENLFVCYEK